MKRTHACMLSCLPVVLAFLVLPGRAGAPGEFSAPSRTFTFTYQVTLKDIPAGSQRVRVWIPRAVTDANQTVVLEEGQRAGATPRSARTAFGNHILYGELCNPRPGPRNSAWCTR